MEVRRISKEPIASGITYDRGEKALSAQVQTGLNLFLKLRNPAQMPALLATIASVSEKTYAALESLHYVHFARFLPTPDFSTLIVITEFDGDLKSYVMDFVAVLGDVFTAMLEFVDGAPRLPVQKYPQDFWDWVEQNNVWQAQPWSAYKHKTVLEIQGTRRVIPTPAQQAALASPEPAHVPTLDLADIQGNILRGFRAIHARLFALRIDDAAGARAFIAGLVGGDEEKSPQITTAVPWKRRPKCFLNIGFTWKGLEALEVNADTLKLFPAAFVKGPAARAVEIPPGQAAPPLVGDVGDSAPDKWVLGGPQNPPAHILLTLSTGEKSSAPIDETTTVLRRLFAAAKLTEVMIFDADALPGGTVHFGYKDGFAQPRIEGVPDKARDMQPVAKAGEFLLGKDYVNQYGGNFIGDLPNALCDNATYGSFGILVQHVKEFEDALKLAGQRYNMDPELVAAKLMGRWRNGVPLALSPDSKDVPMGDRELNDFDYAPSAEHASNYDDFEGLRCPVGAHCRRMNPRGAVVTGKSHSRRIIRRGLPFGPAFDPANPDDGKERGLAGYFICGDLEMQFEFLQSVWGNGDIMTAGLRDTRDPITGAQPEDGGKFTIRTNDTRDPITLHLPRFVTTKGRAYVFVPGIGGLRYLSNTAR